MYLCDMASVGPRPFAEGKGTPSYRVSGPADFGSANFPVPWTTGETDFVIHSNFFTPSPSEVGGKEGGRNLKAGIKNEYADADFAPALPVRDITKRKEKAGDGSWKICLTEAFRAL